MPISTNPGSMEAGEYGLMRGSVSSHVVSKWSWSPGCCGFRGVFWVRRDFVFCFLFLFEHTRPAARMRLPCLIYLSTSTYHVQRYEFCQLFHFELIMPYTLSEGKLNNK